MLHIALRWTTQIGVLLLTVTSAFSVGIAGAEGGPSARPQPVDRLAVVVQMLAANNRGDVAGAVGGFSEDATLISGPVCTLQQPCQGAAAIGSAVTRNTAVHTTITIISAEVIGSAVAGRWEVRNDRLAAIGVDRLVEVFIAQVPYDAITLLVSSYDFTDAQTAALVGPR